MTSNSKNCCRLCLAPENECVEIFRTKAADKQPIQTKITACLHIQVCTHWVFILPNNVMNHLEVEATTHVVQCVGKIDNVRVCSVVMIVGRSHASTERNTNALVMVMMKHFKFFKTL